MEKFTNEVCNELINFGFTPQDTVRVLNALSRVMRGYDIVSKQANLSVYDCKEATDKLIKTYITCKLVEDCNKTYCQTMYTRLHSLFAYCGRGVKECTSFDIRAFILHIKESGNVANSTINAYLHTIQRFYDWLAQEGYSSGNPAKHINDIRVIKKETESLTSEQVEIIRATLETWRERALIEFLLSTGCRVAELRKVKISDLDFKSKTVLMFCKGSKEHRGLLSDRAIVAIKTYLQKRGYQSEYLFCSEYEGHPMLKCNNSIAKMLKKIASRLPEEVNQHIHAHLFRHTAATLWIDKGMPIQDVQVALGHSRIDTTRGYIKGNIRNTLIQHEKYAI